MESAEEATRRTSQGGTAHAAPSASADGRGAEPAPTPGIARKGARAGRRFLRTVLLLIALVIIGNQVRFASIAGRSAAAVPSQELEDLDDAWRQYEELRGWSMRFGVAGLERALTRQTAIAADRVIGNYRTPLPTVREAQWRMAREALAHAVSVRPDDTQLKASLRYCDGHLHRINGEARLTRRQTAEAQHEFTEAVAAFREAAELRPNWPDPFLGLMRTFIYGLADVDRGADALKQAQRLGDTPGDRETAQLADGYRARAETLARTARTLNGMAQEHEYLARAAEAYRQALGLYTNVPDFAGVARNIRVVRRGLAQVEQRIAELARPTI